MYFAQLLLLDGGQTPFEEGITLSGLLITMKLLFATISGIVTEQVGRTIMLFDIVTTTSIVAVAIIIIIKKLIFIIVIIIIITTIIIITFS